MINIYLLGHEVEGLDEVVTYVYPQPFNQNSERIETKGDKKVAFINELSHDMIIVQIPKIRKVNLRTKLDELLSIFYQEDIKKTKHEIEVDETKLGDDHKYLVRLLASAYGDEDMAKNMEMEDELNVLIDNAVQTNATLKEQVNKQKEQIDSQKEQIDLQKEQIDSQKKQLSISIKMLRDFGLSDSEIAQRLKIAEADVNDIQKQQGELQIIHFTCFCVWRTPIKQSHLCEEMALFYYCLGLAGYYLIFMISIVPILIEPSPMRTL